MNPNMPVYQGNRPGQAMSSEYSSTCGASPQTQGPASAQGDPFSNNYGSGSNLTYPGSVPDPVYAPYSDIPNASLQPTGSPGYLDAGTQADPMFAPYTPNPRASLEPPNSLKQSSTVASPVSAAYNFDFDALFEQLNDPNSLKQSSTVASPVFATYNFDIHALIEQLNDPNYQNMLSAPKDTASTSSGQVSLDLDLSSASSPLTNNHEKRLTKAKQEKLDRVANPTRNKDGRLRKKWTPRNLGKSHVQGEIKLEAGGEAGGSEDNKTSEHNVTLAKSGEAAGNSDIQGKPKSKAKTQRKYKPKSKLTEPERLKRNAIRLAQLHRQKARQRAEAARLAGVPDASTGAGNAAAAIPNDANGVSVDQARHAGPGRSRCPRNPSTVGGAYATSERVMTRQDSAMMLDDERASSEDLRLDEGSTTMDDEDEASSPEPSQPPDEAGPSAVNRPSASGFGDPTNPGPDDEDSEENYSGNVWTNDDNTFAPKCLKSPLVWQTLTLKGGNATNNNLSSGIPDNSTPSTNISVPEYDWRRVVMYSRGARGGRNRYEKDDHGHIWFFDVCKTKNPTLVFDGVAGAHVDSEISRHHHGRDFMMTLFCCLCRQPMGSWEQGDFCSICIDRYLGAPLY